MFWLQPVTSITACMQPDLGWIICAGFDFLHPIQFHSSNKVLDQTVQNWPGSKLDGLVRFWLNPSGPQTSQCSRIIRPSSGRMQPACYEFPIFRLGCILPQTAWIILCKTGLDPVWFWLTVSGAGQMDPVQKQASVEESSGPLLANTFELIWIRSGMFTGQSTHSKKSGLATGTLLEQLIRKSMLTRTAGSTHSKM